MLRLSRYHYPPEEAGRTTEETDKLKLNHFDERQAGAGRTGKKEIRLKLNLTRMLTFMLAALTRHTRLAREIAPPDITTFIAKLER